MEQLKLRLQRPRDCSEFLLVVDDAVINDNIKAGN